MNSAKAIEIRREVLKLKVGEKTSVHLGDDTHSDYIAMTVQFARSRSMFLKVEMIGQALHVEKLPQRENKTVDLSSLQKIGDEIIADITPEQLLSLRARASAYASARNMGASVWQHQDGKYRVTMMHRMGSTPAVEVMDHIAAERAPSTRQVELRWEIDKLEVGGTSWVPIAEEPLINKIRTYLNYHGPRLGRRFRVSAEGGFTPAGGHRITRLS